MMCGATSTTLPLPFGPKRSNETCRVSKCCSCFDWMTRAYFRCYVWYEKKGNNRLDYCCSYLPLEVAHLHKLELFNQELVVVVVFVAVIEVNLFNFRGCCRHLYHFRSRAELDASVL
uniref:Uncharacterized protein n=1 Tax=Daphnia galeata TaxID=27404 RepID=A0A8J2WBV0_9CRUS|nr:unnamed protein product [Daphnia galeata]